MGEKVYGQSGGVFVHNVFYHGVKIVYIVVKAVDMRKGCVVGLSAGETVPALIVYVNVVAHIHKIPAQLVVLAAELRKSVNYGDGGARSLNAVGAPVQRHIAGHKRA